MLMLLPYVRNLEPSIVKQILMMININKFDAALDLKAIDTFDALIDLHTKSACLL